MKLFILSALLLSFCAHAERNLILITIDGLRWQEVFKGAQANLLAEPKFVKDKASLEQKFQLGSAVQNRQALMPFIWHTIAKQGVLIGNREQGSFISVANDLYFSYPGYNDLLTGVVNPKIRSNAKVNNDQVSFLEWLNNKPSYHSNVALFGGWDVFPYIVNQIRSGLHVNAGFATAAGYPLSERVKWLGELQQQIPSPWKNVRLDAFTYGFAEDYLEQVQPRVMMLAFAETDDFAHDGDYQNYLHSAHRTDMLIGKLWQKLQTMAKYKDNTNIIIVTDHGRGANHNDWQHHASKKSIQGYMKGLSQFQQGIIGSEHIWLAAIGPDIKPLGQVKTNRELRQTQVAATALKLLGEDPEQFNANAAKAIMEILR